MVTPTTVFNRSTICTSCLVIVIGIFLTSIARWNQLDITNSACVIATLFVFILVCSTGAIYMNATTFSLICATSFSLFYSLKFLFETQKILKEGEFCFLHEEYVYAAALLYLDVVSMFLYIRLAYYFMVCTVC